MSKQTITWIAVILLLIAAGAGVWLWQRRQNDDEVARLNERIEELESQTQSTEEADENQQASAEALHESDVSEPTAPVVFDPPGRFSDEEQASLNESVLEPHALYHADQGAEVAAYYIVPREEPETFEVTAIFTEDDAHESFLVGGDDGIVWSPDCLDMCEFSDEFTDKYPEIVERAQ